MDPTVPERIEYYLNKLTGTDWEDAWHSLVEMGPGALPHVIHAFELAHDRSVALKLILVVNEYRTPAALSFLTGLLKNADPDIWKTVLSGIVTLGGSAAAECLRGIRKTLNSEKMSWVEEAIDQITKSGAN